MTPGGRPAASQQPHDVVGAQHRARRRLPDDGVAHQRRRGRQVAGNRREVERRDRVDEALERPVLELVPHRVRADRLLRVAAPARKDGLKRQKSISSDAASISAWNAVFDCPSIVAALSVARHVVVSSSAAARRTPPRDPRHDQRPTRGVASAAAAIACCTCCSARPRASRPARDGGRAASPPARRVPCGSRSRR